MQRYTVEIVLAIDAMNEESAENKLDTFLSALDLKKNDKISAEVIGDLTQDGEPSKKSTKKVEDDDWANEDWDSMDEDDDDDDDDDDSDDEDETPDEPDEDELTKLLSSINSEPEENPPEAAESSEDDSWDDWDDEESWD